MDRSQGHGQAVEPTMRNCLKQAFIQTFKQYTALSKCADVHTASSHLGSFQESLADLRNLLALMEEQANEYFEQLSGQGSSADNRADDDESVVSSCMEPRKKVMDWLRCTSPSSLGSDCIVPLVASLSWTSPEPTPSIALADQEANSSLAVAYSPQTPLAAGEMIACEVTASLSPIEFFVVPDASRSDLSEIEHRLHALGETLSAVRVEKEELTVGLACCCYLNGVLLRALVMQIGSEDAQVRFVDSGVGRFVPLDQIYPLPAFLAQLPPAAHLCAIAPNTKLQMWTAENWMLKRSITSTHCSRHIALVSSSRLHELVELMEDKGVFGDYVIVGGGIAAVSCAQELASLVPKNASIVVVSASAVVKAASNWRQVGKVAESFDVTEQEATSVFSDYHNITIVPAKIASLDYSSKCVRLDGGGVVRFGKLCIATGGRPKTQLQSDFLLVIRDTETVQTFQRRLKDTKRIVIVGNGGIATELVYGLRNVDIIWAVKHSSICATFFDAGAGQFFLPELTHPSHNDNEATASKRLKYTIESPGADVSSTPSVGGSALGPDWSTNIEIKGSAKERHVHVVYGVEMDTILSPADIGESKSKVTPLPADFEEKQDWNVFVKLSNGEIFGCDLIVCAIGVDPNSEMWTNGNPSLITSLDGGLLVNEQMETGLPGVYAAGDVCTTGWSPAPHWMQMRLWTQARQMGAYTARCMAATSPMQLDICFEIFTHVTAFFGQKVILLGKYNGQGLGADCHALLRVKNGEEYVKVLVEDGRVHGAVLVGETDLEETLENLILNQTDISHIEDGLLDSSVDIEDYFD